MGARLTFVEARLSFRYGCWPEAQQRRPVGLRNANIGEVNLHNTNSGKEGNLIIDHYQP